MVRVCALMVCEYVCGMYMRGVCMCGMCMCVVRVCVVYVYVCVCEMCVWCVYVMLLEYNFGDLHFSWLAGWLVVELVGWLVSKRETISQFPTYLPPDFSPSVFWFWCFLFSSEMLEAVGHEYLGDFYFHCDRLLKMDGLLVVQVPPYPNNPSLLITSHMTSHPFHTYIVPNTYATYSPTPITPIF